MAAGLPLPDELVKKIVECFDTFIDLFRFRAVCHQFRRVAPLPNAEHPSPFPLAPPPFPLPDTLRLRYLINDDIPAIFRLILYVFREGDKRELYVSSGNYDGFDALIRLHLYKPNRPPKLALNSLDYSITEISRSYSFFPFVMARHRFAAASHSPSAPTIFLAISSSLKLFCWSLGFTEWHPFLTDHSFCGIFGYEGGFLSLKEDGILFRVKIAVQNLEFSITATEVVSNPVQFSPSQPYTGTKEKLVFLCDGGAIYLVYTTRPVQVFLLRGDSWIRTSDLGGLVFVCGAYFFSHFSIKPHLVGLSKGDVILIEQKVFGGFKDGVWREVRESESDQITEAIMINPRQKHLSQLSRRNISKSAKKSQGSKIENHSIQQYNILLDQVFWAPYHTITSIPSIDRSSLNSTCLLVLAGRSSNKDSTEELSKNSNAILFSQFDFDAISLSSKPVFRVEFADELPCKMASGPRGDGLICSFRDDCRWFGWCMTHNDGNGGLEKLSSNKLLTKLKDVGPQSSLAFSADGSLLALGGENGILRVIKWHNLEVLFTEKQACASVEDLHFSINGRYLVSLQSGSSCTVWDVTSSKAVASLLMKNDEFFQFCRFSQSSGSEQVLHTVARRGNGGSIISWNTRSWKIASKHNVWDAVTAFNVSVDGKVLAIGTDKGDVVIIDSSTMQVQMNVKKAHPSLVNALTFSHDSRALGSVSMDLSVRVTVIQEKSADGFNYRLDLF